MNVRPDLTMKHKPLKPPHKRYDPLLPGCMKLQYQYKPRDFPRAIVPPGNTRASDCPKITIVVPSYNQGQFIGHTLQSIVDQRYPELDLIIVDGGSTDGSVNIIKHYSSYIKWWVSEADNGQAHAINKGMKHASGDILAWLNSDDCLMPGALFKIAEQFTSSPGTDVVYGHRVLINEDGQDVGKWIMPGHRRLILSYVDFIPQETMYWRRSLWQKTGEQLDESFQFALDWQLIRRFIDAKAKFRLIPAFLGKFRIHELQKTSAKLDTVGFKEMEVIRQRCQQNFSSNTTLQYLYHRMQRASLYSFVARARLTELLWQANLIKIE